MSNSEDNTEVSGIIRKDLDHLLKETLGGEYEVFAEVIGIFLKNAPEFLKNLEEKIKEKDFKGITYESHHMKSSGLAVGAQRFSALCLEIENLGRDEIFEGVESAFSELAKESNICVKFLQEELVRIQEKVQSA